MRVSPLPSSKCQGSLLASLPSTIAFSPSEKKLGLSNFASSNGLPQTSLHTQTELGPPIPAPSVDIPLLSPQARKKVLNALLPRCSLLVLLTASLSPGHLLFRLPNIPFTRPLCLTPKYLKGLCTDFSLVHPHYLCALPVLPETQPRSSHNSLKHQG